MRNRVVVLLLSLVTICAAQTPPESITADFTWQYATFGPLQLYAANVCNSGPVTATVQTYRDVWPRAREKNLLLQTPTAIREVERSLEGSNLPKWILWGTAGGCAIASAVTNGGAVSLDTSKGVGKLVAYGTAGCAIALPIAAERMVNTPGGQKVPVPASEMLPPIFILAAGDCEQGLVYAKMPLDLKVVP